VAALARAVRADDRSALAQVASALDAPALARRAPDGGRALLQVLLQAAARAGDAEVARAVVAAMRSIGGERETATETATAAIAASGATPLPLLPPLPPSPLAAEAHRALLQALSQAGRRGEALRWLREEVPPSALSAKHAVAVARPAMRAGDLAAARAAVDWGAERGRRRRREQEQQHQQQQHQQHQQQQAQREGEAAPVATSLPSPAAFDPDETLASLRLQLAAAEGGAPAVRREWRRLASEGGPPPGVRAHLARLVALQRVAAAAAGAAAGPPWSADGSGGGGGDWGGGGGGGGGSPAAHSSSSSSSAITVQPREMDEALEGLLEAYLSVVWERHVASSGSGRGCGSGSSSSGVESPGRPSRPPPSPPPPPPPQRWAAAAPSSPLPVGPWTGRLPRSALVSRPAPDAEGPTPLERDLLARGLDTALTFYASPAPSWPPPPDVDGADARRRSSPSSWSQRRSGGPQERGRRRGVRRVLDARAALGLPPTARMYAALAQWRAAQSDAAAPDLEALAAEAAAFGALAAAAAAPGGRGTERPQQPQQLQQRQQRQQLESGDLGDDGGRRLTGSQQTGRQPPHHHQAPGGSGDARASPQAPLLAALGLPFFEALGELYAATEGRARDAERAALDRSRAAGLAPTARTYTRLLHGFGGPGDVGAADRAYRRMIASGARPDAQAMARLFRAARTAAQNVRVSSAARARAAGADAAARAAALADRAARFASVYARLAAWQGDMAARGTRHDRVSLHHLAAALERLNALGDCLELAAAQERALLRHAEHEARRRQRRPQQLGWGEGNQGGASAAGAAEAASDRAAAAAAGESDFAAHRSALRVSGRRGGGGDAAGRVAALAERVRAGGGGLSPEDYALVAFSQFWVHRDEGRLLDTAAAMRRDGVRLDSATGHALLHVYAARRLWREALGVVDELLDLAPAGGGREWGGGGGGGGSLAASASSSSSSSSAASSFGAAGDGVWHVALRELARHAAPDDVVGAFASRMSPGQRARFAAMYGLRRTGSGGWALAGPADEDEGEEEDRGGRVGGGEENDDGAAAAAARDDDDETAPPLTVQWD